MGVGLKMGKIEKDCTYRFIKQRVVVQIGHLPSVHIKRVFVPVDTGQGLAVLKFKKYIHKNLIFLRKYLVG